jgi:hypothetical protein
MNSWVIIDLGREFAAPGLTFSGRWPCTFAFGGSDALQSYSLKFLLEFGRHLYIDWVAHKQTAGLFKLYKSSILLVAKTREKCVTSSKNGYIK